MLSEKLMASEYLRIIQTFLDNAITREDGEVVINNKNIDKLCDKLLADFSLTIPYEKSTLNDDDRAKFCQEFNWFYNQLMYISINNSQTSTAVNIRKLICMLIKKIVKIYPGWFEQLLRHQIKILEDYVQYPCDSEKGFSIKFTESENSPILVFKEITANNKYEFEIITCFVLDILQAELQVHPALIAEFNLPIVKLVTAAFKRSSMIGKTPALWLLEEYLSASDRKDSIQILTNVMEGLARHYQWLHISMAEMPSDQEFYMLRFVPSIVNFCNTLMLTCEGNLVFSSPIEQKIFVNVFTDVIYQEYKFVKLGTHVKSIITKLVSTFDFVMFQGKFSAETIKEGINSLMERTEYDVSEVFPLLKYVIVLELETVNKYDFKVSEISKSWKMVLDKLAAKLQEPPQACKYKCFYLIEWISNVLKMALQSFDLFTRHHQLHHLSNTYCNKCQEIQGPSTDNSMKFDGWEYKHIQLDFFSTDIKALAEGLINLVRTANISESIDILMELFVSLLQLSNNTAFSGKQTLFMLSVIFLPFFPMIEANQAFSSKNEFKSAKESLPENLSQYIHSRNVEQLDAMKISTIEKIAFLKLSKTGHIGTWFAVTITQLMLIFEAKQSMVQVFAQKFKNILIANADIIEKIFLVYRQAPKPLLGYKWLLCLQEKNLIIIKSPDFSIKSLGYEVYCKSCEGNAKREDVKTELNRLLQSSRGYAVSVNGIKMQMKIQINYNFLSPLNLHADFFHSLVSYITHDARFPLIIKEDGGERFLNLILTKDKEIVFHLEYCFDKIMKCILNCKNIDLETKVKFSCKLFDKVSEIARDVAKDASNLRVQKAYAIIVTTIGCNAKEIPLENEIFFKNEVIVAKCFAILAHFMFNDSHLKRSAIEMTFKMFHVNDMTFNEAFHWHENIVSILSKFCLLECIKKNQPFYIVLKRFLCKFGYNEFETFLKKFSNTILASIYPYCIDHNKTSVIDSFLNIFGLKVVDVIEEAPVIIYKEFWEYPKNLRVKYFTYIEESGDFEYAKLFSERKAQVIAQAAVYFAQNNELFNNIIRKILCVYEDSEILDNDYDGIIKTVVEQFLGILVHIDNILMNESADRSLKENALTSVGTLLHFIGNTHTSDFCFNVMGLLKSTARQPSNHPFKKVYIDLWRILIRTCNPQTLGQFLSAIFVALEPYIKDFPEKIEDICDYILNKNQSILGKHIVDLFYIDRTTYPDDVKNRILFQIASQSITDGNDFEINLQRLIRHMRSGNADSDVRNFCLQYLYEFSKINRIKLNELVNSSAKNHAMLSDVLSIILDCCRNKNSCVLLTQAALCFGEIGALSPDLPIKNEYQKDEIGFTIHSDEFAYFMITLLCKDYQDLHQSDHMDYMAAGLQGVIKERKMTPSHRIYLQLTKTNQQLIKPFFNSRYHVNQSELIAPGEFVFWHNAQSSNLWAELVASMLIRKIIHPPTFALLSLLNGSINFNNEIASFLLPFVFLHYFESSDSYNQIDNDIKTEFDFIFSVIIDEKSFKRVANVEDVRSKYVADLFFKPKKPSPNQTKISQSSSEFINVAKQIAKLIFDVIDLLVKFQYHTEKNERLENFLCSFNSKILAQVSFNCGDYERALIYFESYVLTLDKDERENEWLSLVHIYAKLGDKDSIDGVTNKKKHPWSATEKMFIGNTTGKYEDHAICIEEIIRQPSCISMEVVSSTLKCLVAYNNCEQAIIVADCMLKSLYNSSRSGAKQYEYMKAEALLRLSKFDELDEVLNTSNPLDPMDWGSIQAKLLLDLHKGFETSFNEEIKQIRVNVMKNFKIYDSNQSIYKINYDSIVQLHMLADMEKTNEIIRQLKTPNPNCKRNIENFLNEIKARKKFCKLTKMQTESLLALHRSLFKEIRRKIDLEMQSEETTDLFKMIDDEIGKTWRDSMTVYQDDQLDQANAFLIEAQKYNLPELFIQQAKLLWKLNKSPVQTTKILQTHCDALEKTADFKKNPHYAKGLLLIARYNAEASAVDHQTNRDMFQKALTVNVNLDKAYLHFAEYLDRLVFSDGKKESDINLINTEKLAEILEAYGSGLLHGTEYVFQALPRFLQIWLDATMPKAAHKDHMKKKPGYVSAHNIRLNTIAKKYLTAINTFQLYTAFSQIISRICHPCPGVYEILKIIIVKLISNYPRHSLWYVVQAMKSKMKLASDRMKEIFRAIPKAKTLIADFEHFIDGLMEIARLQEVKISDTYSRKINLNLGKSKSKLLMPLQLNLQIFNETVMNNLRDEDQVFIHKMSDEILVLKSMQKPKKVNFTASNGQSYSLMLKSKDDLRIDFRFMEFCKVLNDYFRKDRETSERNFSIRTYAVSPMNEDVGIIEWLQNMETIKNVIKNQYYISKAQQPDAKELGKYASIWQSKHNKVELFKKVESLHTPVLGRWYLSTFSSSQSYFSARQQFIKSTAIMSVVGYLFGLGDRHLENMLIDQNTGEVVHVDFNSMFNSNEKLGVPETVPFRLTRCMIDAMGVLETEGSYRKCCEFTMRLLQHRKNVLVSYLRPFVFDPLIQNFSPDFEPINENSLAAINNIKRKLDGYARKYRKFLDFPLSPEGHVKFIIDEATSPENLAYMYFYWNPYV